MRGVQNTLRLENRNDVVNAVLQGTEKVQDTQEQKRNRELKVRIRLLRVRLESTDPSLQKLMDNTITENLEVKQRIMGIENKITRLEEEKQALQLFMSKSIE